MTRGESHPRRNQLVAAALCGALALGFLIESNQNDVECYGTKATPVLGGLAVSVRVSPNNHALNDLLVETNGQSAPFDGELFIPDSAITPEQLSSGKIRPGIVESGTGGLLSACPAAPFREV